jgi:hypothetical protein
VLLLLLLLLRCSRALCTFWYIVCTSLDSLFVAPLARVFCAQRVKSNRWECLRWQPLHRRVLPVRGSTGSWLVDVAACSAPAVYTPVAHWAGGSWARHMNRDCCQPHLWACHPPNEMSLLHWKSHYNSWLVKL